MALPAANNAEGGTSGTTVTTANSGGTSGTAFDLVTIGGTSTFTADNAHAAHGSLAYKAVCSSGANDYVQWLSTTVGTQTTLYGRLYFYVTANPTVNFYLVSFLATGGTVPTARVRLATTGKLMIVDNLNTADVTSTNTVALNAWNRIEFTFTFSTTTGSGSVSLFSGDSTSAIETISTSAKNFGAANSDTARFGINGAPAMVYTVWMDSMQVNATALPGPDAANATFTGVTATVVLASPIGGVNVSLPGVTATAVFAAPVGAVSVTLPGVTAPIIVTAPAGSTIVPLTLTNTAEGGTNGTTVTTANSGGSSGTAWNALTIGASAQLKYDNSHTYDSLSYKLTPGGFASTWVEWNTSVGTLTTVWGRAYLYFSSTPLANVAPIQIFDGSASRAFCIVVDFNGKVRIKDATDTVVGTTTNSVAVAQWCRIEFAAVASATVGSVEVKLFNSPNSVTPTETLTRTSQNTNTSFGKYSFGDLEATTDTAPFWLDNIAITNVGYIGPVPSNFSAVGVTASVVVGAPVGAVSVTLLGVTATAVFSAPVGAVSVTLPGVTASVVVGAPVGSIIVPLTLTNNAEGGANGATVAVTDTGSGTAWEAITIGAGSTLVYDNSQTYNSFAYKITPFANVSTFLEWNTAAGTQLSVWGRFYLYVPSVPALSWQILQFFNGAVTAFRLGISAIGKILIRDASNVTVGTSINTIVAGWNRIEFAASAIVGSVEVKLFTSPDSVTPVETLTVNSINVNTAFTNYRFGTTPSTATVPGAYWLDNIGLTNIGYLGPVSVSAKSTPALLVTF